MNTLNIHESLKRKVVMEQKKNLITFLFLFFIVVTIILITGCQNSPVEPQSSDTTTDKQAMEGMIDQDSSIASFEPNYNEEDVMGFLGKTSTAIYPIKIGNRVRLVNRTINIDVLGDSAYGTITRTYEGVLLIAAAYDTAATTPDTLIKKLFTSVVTQNVIFKRVANTSSPLRNWKLAAISLPEGGTASPNIDLTKVTMFLPSGDTLMITSPNDYYLSRNIARWRQIPVINRNQPVTIQVELFSSYEEDDFVTLTYGADQKGMNRAKRKFELVSSTPSGNGFAKIYQQIFTTHQFPGFFHAVINAYPRQVIFDDAAPVENEMWGIPYAVKR
ncbi:MAG: hypothetical protein K8H86_13650 [Ignavibacteriaceae bacterium]|nr:hypothetical protein [Ignavibacteriaceae bacterium]